MSAYIMVGILGFLSLCVVYVYIKLAIVKIVQWIRKRSGEI